jgi:hypothetical protein
VKQKATCVLLMLTLLCVLLVPGCATLTRKRMQRIPVTSSPAGATVFVNDVEQGATPIEISLLRHINVQVIRIESPAYDPVEIRPQRRMATISILGNIMLGLACACAIPVIWSSGFDTGEMGAFYLGIGLRTAGFAGLFEVLDLSLKKGYEFRPTELIVTLKKAEGFPCVDTILVDADDFRNVKWIRVHFTTF